MSNDVSSTGHAYDAVLADLRAEAAELETKLSQLRGFIQVLEVKKSAARLATAPAQPAQVDMRSVSALPTPTFRSQATETKLSELGLGDACVEAIRAIGGRATNNEILRHLNDNGYVMNSTKPLNNVGTGLNHRRKNRGDIFRDGKHWVLKKSESPAVNGASHMNGAAAQPA